MTLRKRLRWWWRMDVLSLPFNLCPRLQQCPSDVGV